MKKVIVIFVIFLLTIVFVKFNTSEATTRIYQTIDTEKVYKVINNPSYKIVDVRTIAEYASGHIEGSINVSLNNINSIEDYIPNKDTNIIVYCMSGSRSKKAADTLLSLGYTHVYDMGGLDSWNYDLVK